MLVVVSMIRTRATLPGGTLKLVVVAMSEG